MKVLVFSVILLLPFLVTSCIDDEKVDTASVVISDDVSLSKIFGLAKEKTIKICSVAGDGVWMSIIFDRTGKLKAAYEGSGHKVGVSSAVLSRSGLKFLVTSLWLGGEVYEPGPCTLSVLAAGVPLYELERQNDISISSFSLRQLKVGDLPKGFTGGFKLKKNTRIFAEPKDNSTNRIISSSDEFDIIDFMKSDNGELWVKIRKRKQEYWTLQESLILVVAARKDTDRSSDPLGPKQKTPLGL